ncbi:lanthionine synthetase C family protein [Kitasatospora sp. NPDC101157]|uniref:lanthionine synthetase C family protein n=1 Tax=Kitasatospora sp. NPDC101157 TaxID=3364098 RepID=UPI0037FEFF26
MPGSTTGHREPTSPWASALDASRRSTTLFVARDVAVRVADRARIRQCLPLARRQTRYPEFIKWTPYGLAEGNSGIAVMCSYFDRCLPGEGWDAIGHGFLAEGVTALDSSRPIQSGLFSGFSGFAFALGSLSRDGNRYQRLLTGVDEMLAPQASAAAARLGTGPPGVPVSAFDLVSGASGVAASLLERDPHGVLPGILTALVRLVEPTDGIPRWVTPPELLTSESMRQLYPSGNLNCGLAHGIPGPLALLSLALRAGHEVPGQAEAVNALAHWLASHGVDDAWGVGWPDALTPAGQPASQMASAATRSAWCYGTPGVARSLWHAGEALNDEDLRRTAVKGMTSVLRRPVELRYIDSPTFCHGIAGLLHIVLRFAYDTASDCFMKASTDLVDQLLAAYEPDRPFGFASLEAENAAVDRAGLLNGASGVAMTLLAAATGVDPAWDRMFLLS